MKSFINYNNKLNHQLLNKGYFSSLNKKIIFSLYMVIKNEFKKKLGRYSSSIHDKKLFLCEYKELMKRVDNNISILGDKGYSGLKDLIVEILIKRNELKYKENKDLIK